MTISAFFKGQPGLVPLPTYEIFEVGVGSVETGNTVELGGGWYVVTGEPATDGSEYTWTITAGALSAPGVYSGTERARGAKIDQIHAERGLTDGAPITFDAVAGTIQAPAAGIDVAITTLGNAVTLTSQ